MMGITKSDSSIRTFFVVYDDVEYDVHVTAYDGLEEMPLVFVRGPEGWRTYSAFNFDGTPEQAAEDTILLYAGDEPTSAPDVEWMRVQHAREHQPDRVAGQDPKRDGNLDAPESPVEVSATKA